MTERASSNQAEFASVIANANLATTPASHQVVVQAQLAL
jgi:hypothetical protein